MSACKKYNLAMMLKPEQVSEYAAKGMSLKEIADMFGYTKQRIGQVIHENEELYDAWQVGHARLVDTLTSALLRQVEKDNIVAVIFALKAKCGWVEEQYRKLDNTQQKPNVTLYLPVVDGENT